MKQKGFTLLELMIVVTVIGILAAIAIPMMQGNDLKARRAVAKSVMMDFASKQEEWFVNNKTYTQAFADFRAADPYYINANGDYVAAAADGFYQISLVADTTTYTVTATPMNRQQSDVDCGTLTITQASQKGASGTKGSAGCW